MEVWGSGPEGQWPQGRDGAQPFSLCVTSIPKFLEESDYRRSWGPPPPGDARGCTLVDGPTQTMGDGEGGAGAGQLASITNPLRLPRT